MASCRFLTPSVQHLVRYLEYSVSLPALSINKLYRLCPSHLNATIIRINSVKDNDPLSCSPSDQNKVIHHQQYSRYRRWRHIITRAVLAELIPLVKCILNCSKLYSKTVSMSDGKHNKMYHYGLWCNLAITVNKKHRQL